MLCAMSSGMTSAFPVASAIKTRGGGNTHRAHMTEQSSNENAPQRTVHTTEQWHEDLVKTAKHSR